MKLMKRWFNNLKLAHKFALIASLALLVISLTAMALLKYVTDKYNQVLYEKTSMAMDYLVSNLETGLKDIATVTDYLTDNAQIQDVLTVYTRSEALEERARSKRSLYDSLYSYFNSSAAIVAIVVALPDGTMVRMGYSGQDFSLEPWKALEARSDQAGGRLVWQGGSDFDNAVVCARQIRRKEYLKLDKLATLFVEIDMDRLMDQAFRSASTADSVQLILDTGEDMLFYPFPFPAGLAQGHYSASAGYEILQADGGMYFVCTGSLPYTGWRYIHFSDYQELFSHLNAALKAVLAVLAVSTLAVILSEYAVINRIACHFRALDDKMKHFESGSLEPLPVKYDYSLRSDEIGMLHRRFDRTVQSYKTLVHDNYRKQLLLKDASIRNLEQQIHPHFLYNVLDSIYLMAEAHDMADIADMSHALANLFRASVSENSPTIPLRHELNYLDSYIRIQLIRFKDHIRFTSRCDEACMDIPIPKLSIQPLVENAVKHGIEECGEDCDIILTVRKKADGTYISVSNTGSRFMEDMDSRILFPGQNVQEADTSVPPENHGIGLKNINERLQLIYGKSCRLHFVNENHYAVVYFVIPIPPHTAGLQYCTNE